MLYAANSGSAWKNERQQGAALTSATFSYFSFYFVKTLKSSRFSSYWAAVAFRQRGTFRIKVRCRSTRTTVALKGGSFKTKWRSKLNCKSICLKKKSVYIYIYIYNMYLLCNSFRVAMTLSLQEVAYYISMDGCKVMVVRVPPPDFEKMGAFSLRRCPRCWHITGGMSSSAWRPVFGF